jgi:diguanylate cyclase (GGDEF)-like protein
VTAEASAQPRTLAPPERRVAPVTANERVGAYSLITVLDPDGPADPQPGQFYMLAAAEGWGGGGDERPYLPRAFSYARAQPTPDGVELSFLLEAIGPGTERLARLEPGEGLAGQAVAEGRPLMTNDYRALDQRPRDPIYEAIRSGLAVPMHWDGQLRGALTAGFTRTKLVTADELGLLGTFAEIAAAACRNASAHADLAVAARTDALTGCLNHAAFHASLRLELERTRRTGGRLSLAMLDLDEFKQVNELHGHLAGDEVLRAVGQALRDQVRAYDPVARYGGDEFALIALDAGEAAAAELAERALATLARVEHAAATAGVAEWDSGETATELIERADRALRFAKHEGERATAQRASLVPAAPPALKRP